MKVCFFCASSEALDADYYKLAINFAYKIAQKNWTLVTGGSNVGLMKTLTLAAIEKKGETIGVIPTDFANKGLACYENTELMFTEDMHERKKKLFEISDAFVILPGGFGTLDEMLEIITLKQVGVYNKPIVIFNKDGFFDNILKQFEQFFEQKFAKQHSRNVYFISQNIDETIDYIENYKIQEIDSYWFDVSQKIL